MGAQSSISRNDESETLQSVCKGEMSTRGRDLLQVK